jgi:cell wall assembly regulator SMI1
MAPFDEVIQRFWEPGQVPGGTSGVHPPLTRETVSEAERELGVRLPADYLALLRVQNGGRVSDDCDGFVVDPPGPRGETHVGLVDMDGLGGPGFHVEVERSERRHDPDYGPPEGLVLIGSPDGGHQFLALDYRACGPDGEPSVLWTDTELVSAFELAPSFRAFVEGLRPIASIPGAMPTQEELDAATPRPWPVRLLRRLRR